MEFNKWLSSIQQINNEADSPISIRNAEWSVNERKQLWDLFVENIYDSHLYLIKEAAIEILSEIDPALELPVQKRYSASLEGKNKKFSEIIRKNIATTLALIGISADKLTKCTVNKPYEIVVTAVHEIFKDSNWKIWASLNDLIPILAEAAPDEFLNCVEKALKINPCPFDEVFAQEDSGFTGRNYMTGLLWALETLAWSEDYIARVILILAELAQHDPGGKWVNRPFNSIIAIFLPWHLQTMADLDKRVGIIKALTNNFPNIAWRIVLNLLPGKQGFSSGTQRPKYRDFIPEGWEISKKKDEYIKQIKQYSEIALDMVKGNFERTLSLVEEIDNLPEPYLSKFIEYLTTDAVLKEDEKQKMLLWEKLISFVNKHRRFSTARWALPAEIVDKIAGAAEKLKPIETLNEFHILFTNNDYDLYEENGNWEQERIKLEKKRLDAINAIYSQKTMSGIITFVEQIQNASLVGWLLSKINATEAENNILPEYILSQSKKLSDLAAGYTRGRFEKERTSWLDKLDFSKWSNEQRLTFLLFIHPSQDIWQRLKQWLGDYSDKYWELVGVDPHLSLDELLYLFDSLLSANRPMSALECLFWILFNNKKLDSERAIRALKAATSTTERIHSMDQYHLKELISKLQNTQDVNKDEIATIEWMYLPLLDEYSGLRPKYLEGKLANEPDFFCDLIRLMFRSKNEKREDIKVDKETEAKASNAWNLMHAWKTPPGLLDDNSFSEQKLNEWYSKVRKKCEETGHLEIAMEYVGHVLINVPVDPGGLWIHKAAAKLLDANTAKNEREGYCVEIYNSRGAHTVNLSGEDERKLANFWRERAKSVEAAGFIRFATSLKELANSYDREAEWVRDEHKNRFKDK